MALRIESLGVKRLSRWVMFSPHPLTIVLPNSECILLIRDKDIYHKIKALIIGLSMYRAEYEVSKFSGTIAAELVEVVRLCGTLREIVFTGVSQTWPPHK